METRTSKAGKGGEKKGKSSTPQTTNNHSIDVIDTLVCEESVEHKLKTKQESYYVKMGASLDDEGCTFTLWAPHADTVLVKYKDKAEKVHIEELHKTNVPGYGDSCYSAFIKGVKEGTLYRYIIEYGHNPYERADAWGQSIIYPNWTFDNQDDSDAWSVVTSREFSWNENYPMLNWNEMVIYQLHIGTFFSQRPGLPAKISSITKMIDHFKTLGINVIQLLPFTEFASKLSLGYNSMLPYAIEKDYGTPAEFKEFIQACHDNGILVFLDVIFSHIDIMGGSKDPKPYSLADYDGWQTRDYPDGLFFFDYRNICTPWGAPRPNYSLSGVRHYLIDNIRMFIDEYKIDGFRFDSTKAMRKLQNDNSGSCNGGDILVDGRNYGWELMQTINNLIFEAYPHTFSIAEDLDCNEWITKKTVEGGAGFDSQWDCSMQDCLQDILTKPFDEMVNLNALADAIQNPLGGDPLHRIIYMESHDNTRTRRMAKAIEPGNPEGWYARKKTMLGMGIIMTVPGIPMIFQGQEFLSWKEWDDQKPIDWNQIKKFPKYFQYYSDLIQLRTKGKANGLCGPNVHIVQCNNQTKILAFRRWQKADGSDEVMVVANFSSNSYHSYTLGFSEPGNWFVRLNSDANKYADLNDFNALHCYDTTSSFGYWDNLPYHGNIAIGPYSIIVLSK